MPSGLDLSGGFTALIGLATLVADMKNFHQRHLRRSPDPLVGRLAPAALDVSGPGARLPFVKTDKFAPVCHHLFCLDVSAWRILVVSSRSADEWTPALWRKQIRVDEACCVD
jgi:hypothetical protein